MNADESDWLTRRNARIEEVVRERLAGYQASGVRVFTMFIDPEDTSTDEPERWVACDHATGEVIQRVTRQELDTFYREHPDWVEYTALLDEVQEDVSDEV